MQSALWTEPEFVEPEFELKWAQDAHGAPTKVAAGVDQAVVAVEMSDAEIVGATGLKTNSLVVLLTSFFILQTKSLKYLEVVLGWESGKWGKKLFYLILIAY